MSRRLVIDTDIGTDVDDLWTLAMIPRLADVDVEAVTVVYGDTGLRARLAALALAGMGLDIPVHAGRAEPMSGKDVMWAGFEGVGVDGLDDRSFADGDAVEVLIDRAAADPGTLEILAIGPLTNIAAAIEADPAFADQVGHLTVMGGEFAHGWNEHNFSSDAVATRVVVESGIAMTIMPLDQTLPILIDRSDEALISAGHVLGDLLHDQTERFWSWIADVVPAATGDQSPAHDPAALLARLEPEFVTVTPMAVTVEADGLVRGTPEAGSPVGVVTASDAEGLHDRILALLGVPTT